MNANHKIDIPQFVKEQLKKQSISPDHQKPRQMNFHRRLTSSQLDAVTPLNSNNLKKNNKKQSMHGLQQLLKTSPYSKVIQQKSHSQMLHSGQESFSQQYLKDNINTPITYTSQQQNFFKSQLKPNLSQNSTMSSSVKPRIRSANKFQKQVVETTQMLSNREKDKQTISALQNIIIRTHMLLNQYQQEMQKQTQEKEELVRYIQKIQSSQLL